MAVKVTKRIYNEIYTDGETDWLLGNVADWQTAKITVEVGIEFFATQQTPVTINQIENSFTLASGEDWGQLGFDNGMSLTLSYKFEQDTNGDGEFDSINTIVQTFNILNVFGSVMEVDGTIDVQGYENIPTNFGSKKITEVHFYVDEDPEGCRLFYGHLTNENFESENLNSFIDGTETQFVFPNFNSIADGQFIDMEGVGLQSGMSIRQARVRKIGTSSDDILTEYNIPNSGSLGLVIFDTFFTNPDYNSIRSTRANITNSTTNHQSATSEGVIGQSNSGGQPNNAIQSQCFVFNASSAYSQEIFFNLNIRVIDTEQINASDGSLIRLSVLRFTNGSSFDFVERTTLREWTAPNTLINQTLNYNGLKTFNINGSDSLLLAVEFVRPGPFNNVPRGLSYQWVDGFMQLSQRDGSLNAGIRRTFEFEIQYMISSMFDSVLNFENLELPSYLEGNGSITDNFRFEFFPEWNNPNVVIRNVMEQTARLGNTGWYNENFNELNNDFEIESVEYLDEVGNPVDSLDYTAKTKVKITIGGVPNLNNNTECGFGFAWIPVDEEDYRNKETPFYRNVFVQSGDLDDGFPLNQLFPGPYVGAGLDGASMDAENVKFTSLAGKIIAEITFNPNNPFFTLFDSKDEADRNFIIWVSVADGELGRNFSDRVSLLADFGIMVKNIPPAGPYPYIENAFIEHPFDENATGEDVYKGLIQDDVLCRLPFKIPSDQSEIFQRMTFGVEAFNISENRTFDLERYEIDLTQFPTSGGAQQFDIDQVRGFKLETGNNKNWVKIERDDNGDNASFFGYLAYYAFKIRWEDWIANPDTPNDFFDALQENNGFHNDWIHYLRTQNWSLNFFIEIVSEQDGDLVEYRNQFPFEFADYDENPNIDTTHQYFRNSDDTLLNVGTDPETGTPLGVVLSNEETRIEITFDILDSGTWDILNTYAVTTIEIDRGAGQLEMRQLSSVWGSESDNPLKPVAGQSRLKMEVDGTQKQLKTTCLIDPNLLDDAIRYRITGRVGCYANAGVKRRLYERRYESLYE